MDVNGTRFHLKLGRRDWKPVIAASRAPELAVVDQWLDAIGAAPATREGDREAFNPLAWDGALGGISLVRRLPRLAAVAGTGPFSPGDRRGACADAFGNVFWIGADEDRIRVLPAGGGAASDWWSVAALAPAAAPSPGAFRPAAPPAPVPDLRLRGLAVTTSHLLVAGAVGPGGLLVQDLDAGGDPVLWRWPEALGFAPFALAPAPDGGVAILDLPAAGPPRLWRLDRALQPAEAAAPAVIDAPAPVDVLVLPDGSILVLDAGADAGPARVLRHRAGSAPVAFALDAAAVAPHLSGAITGGHAFAFVPEPDGAEVVRGTLFLATRDAAQAFAFDLVAVDDRLDLKLAPRVYPLQGFGGKGLVPVRGDVRLDLVKPDRWLALAEQPRARFFPEAWVDGEPLRFDGKQPQCVWHRVALDACVPPGTELLVSARAADEKADLDAAPWEDEPRPLRRADGSELPFDRPFGDTAEPRFGTFETLLQSAVGRWLELRLVLRGDGRGSPRVRALRAWYPRFSYLKEYLPAVYREDAASASFLDRFLANPEGIFTAIEGRVERAEALLDPRVAPPEFLPWLAGWMGASLDGAWEDARRRLFLANAWLLFRWRGTPLGLLALVRLATDPCPDASIFEPLRGGSGSASEGYGGSRLRIVEAFELRAAPDLLFQSEDRVLGPGTVPLADRWTPPEGGAALRVRWGRFLRDRYASPADAGADEATVKASTLARIASAWDPAPAPASLDAPTFPPREPDAAGEARDWRDFAASALAAPWAPVRDVDAAPWRAFLARRYANPDALSDAWGLAGPARLGSFAAVALPAQDALPADGAPLRDWSDFASLALPIRRSAHRFTVLVPALPQEAADVRARRAAQVEAVVRREKPAHTDFDVKLFWALFRVGLARLGVDTVLGDGGRFVAMVLDAGHLGEGWLAEGHPWTSGRPVVGRDRLRG